MKLDQATLNQIFAQNIKYLLDAIAGIAKTAPNMYSNGSQKEGTTGAYYDYKILASTGLPYFEPNQVQLVIGNIETGGTDLTPTINDLNAKIAALQSSLETLDNKVDTNKNAVDQSISSINGTISSLETRVTALEAG